VPSCKTRLRRTRSRLRPAFIGAASASARAGFILSDTAGFRDRKLGVEIYINHRPAKTAFDLLASERQAIEAEFSGTLDWQRLDEKKACRIAVFRTDMDPKIGGPATTAVRMAPRSNGTFFPRLQR
jgi:hypothetical protein